MILDNVSIGICRECGARYYHASVLRRAAEIATGLKPPERVIAVPVGSYQDERHE